MKKYIYTVGTVTLALAMSGLPAFALAENGGGEVGVNTQVRVQAEGVQASTSASARVGEGKQSEATSSNEQGNLREATSSNNQASSTRPSIKGGEDSNENVQNRNQGNQEIDLELESTTTPALSFGQLQKSIEQRKQELDQEEASTTPENRGIVANANPVRLAVHALLASKNLIGGIGQQVSEIAKHMNDSVASTTKAEAKIQSRGFFAHLFFGGDTTSAEVIAQEAAQNQARIDSLTALLAQANISADVQVTLKAQITALQTAQARLQALAQKEKSAWGLFSWRF